MAENKSERFKSLKRTKCEGEGKDIISNFPDTIVQHILSFLPTFNVVATSILSSRWKYLWISMPVLEFKELGFHTKTTFVKFVDSVLLLHYRSNVWKFSLTCRRPDFHHLNSWITTALVKYKLQVLNIDYYPHIYAEELPSRFVFPRCLFMPESLATLTSLKLDVKCALSIPSSIHFAKLKILHLCRVHLSSDNFTQQALFDFPLLEEFSMEFFELVDIKTITISAPKLKRLIMNDDWYSLSGDSLPCCEIKVYAESLIFLHIQSALFYDYSLILPTLLNAFVNVCGCATKLLSTVCNVKDLTIAYMDFYASYDSSHPITFPYLINLTVSDDSTWSHVDLISLLDTMPNLELLHITHKIFIDENEDWIVRKMPMCLLSRLKAIQIDEFVGDANDLHVVVFFLKNARVLEKMTLVARWKDQNMLVQVKRRLLMIPRSSTQCTIDLRRAILP